MLRAFKLADGMLVPFVSVHQATKSVDTHELDLIIATRDRPSRFYFTTPQDRDQQLANFEAWLTTPTLL